MWLREGKRRCCRMKYLILYVSIYYENGRKNVSGVSREREKARSREKKRCQFCLEIATRLEMLHGSWHSWHSWLTGEQKIYIL